MKPERSIGAVRRRGVRRALPLGGLLAALVLCAAPRMSAQLATSLSPPIFTLPTVKDTFPGSTQLVPPIGTVTAPAVAVNSLNEVSAETTVVGTVGSVGSVQSDPGSLSPTTTTRGGPKMTLQRPVLAGGPNRTATQLRVGGVPLSGGPQPGGLSLNRESSSYAKLDALSPELLAARRADAASAAVLAVRPPSAANAGLGSAPGLSFAFRPSAPGSPALGRRALPASQAQVDSAARSRQALQGSSLKSVTIRPSAKRVPKIPRVGIDLRNTAPSLR